MVYNIQFEDWELRIGYWWVSHKIFLKRFLVFFLLFFDVVLLSFSAVNWINYFSHDIFYLDKLASSILYYNLDYKHYYQLHHPQEPFISEIGAVNLEKNKYNFFAKVKNTNSDWVIEKIEYYFVYNNKVSHRKTNFILPNSEKFLAVFNIEVNEKVYRPTFKIASIKWKRLKKADVEEFAKKANEYFQFDIKDKKFSNNIFNRAVDKSPWNEITFKVTNNTVYNFYEVGFIIATYSGPSLTSINYYKVFDFSSGQTKVVSKRWPGVISRPSEIIVNIDIPIWEKDIIKPLPRNQEFSNEKKRSS